MMDMLDFSEEEIQGQLAILGYTNIPQHRLQEFKRDLDELIQHGKWGSPTSPPRQETTLKPSPPAYTKERVSGCCVCGDPERRAVLTACPDRDPSWKQGRCDSYAQHSVAPKLQLPPGVPTRIQVELEPASSPASTPDTQGRHVIKRKVLRKQNGLSLVCEESVYSDDSEISHTLTQADMYKMYNAQWDEDSEDEKNSLHSSFWSDGETQEEEVEREQMTEVDTEPAREEEPMRDARHQCLVDSDEGGDDDEGSSSSPAASMTTSGYGTFRPDDHMGAEFEQDSCGDSSERRDDDDEDDGSAGRFDMEPTGEPKDEGFPPVAKLENEAGVWCCGRDGCQKEMDAEGHVKPEEAHASTGEGWTNEGHRPIPADELLLVGETVDSWPELGDGDQCGGLEAGSLHVQVEDDEDRVETEDLDESSSNKDIKFIDSKADLSWTPIEWDGVLLPETASHLDLLPVPAQHDSDLEDEDGSSRSSSSEADGGSSSLESYIRGLFEQTRSDGDLRPKPKSFIRPVMSQPTVKRSDPVAKYFEYKQLWEMFKAPGERDRRALRREIKDRLAHQPPPPKPRRVLAPNTYIVPTEKKRSALRWEIRNDLANGLIPHKFTY